MPTITRLFIKAGFFYLAVALLAAIVTVLPAGATPVPLGPMLGPTALHLLTVGWITQLIFGVAHWMFPRFSRERPRGREALAWAAFGLLNLGLVLRAIGEPLDATASGTLATALLLASAVTQWAAGIIFTIHIWPRVKRR